MTLSAQVHAASATSILMRYGSSSCSAGPLILPELPEDLARFAQRLLQERGVEIHLNTRLAGATAEYALLDRREKIPTKTLVSTVPSVPNPFVTALPCK